jgi:succinoglycan biosynthesis transport protein ExoP
MIEPREVSRISLTGMSLAPGQIRRAPPGALNVLSASDDIFRVVWRSRWLVLLSVLVAMAAGFAYVDRIKPIYVSTSKLYVQQNAPPFLRTEFGEPPRYNLYTQAALLSSTRILNAALATPEFTNMRTFAETDSPLAYLASNIRITVGKNDDIITVSFGSPYPSEAAGIVNGVVNAFMADHEENTRKTSTDLLGGLQRERDRKNQELDRKRGELAELRKKSVPLNMELDRAGTAAQEFQRLSAALADAKISTVTAATRYEGVKDRAKDPNSLREYLDLSAARGSPDPSTSRRMALVQRLFELELNRRSLLITNELTANHPQVKVIHDEVEQIRAELGRLDDQFVRTQLGAAEQCYLDAKTKEEQIARLYDEQRQQAVALNEQLVDHQRLTSEIQELTQYLGTVQQQIRAVNVTEDLELDTLKIRVMEVARPAASPSEPHTSKAMTVALVLGLLLGGILAVVRGWIDQTPRSVEEISASLGLPVLGVVPTMSRRYKAKIRGRMVLLHPESLEAEAFRTIRTAVLFGAPRDKAKTLLITSPTPGGGKSTLVSNLGIALARAGQRTIILDADFRRPAQKSIFGVDHEEKCLSGVFAGRITLAEAVEPAEVRGLSLLTCGPGFSDPAEVIHSQRFARLLQRLAQVYDRILIDAPPVTVVTDAQILGALCDFTILVLKADRSTRQVAQHAIDALQSVGAHLLGVVVNEVPRGDRRYRYYRRYQKHHYLRTNQGGNGQKASTPVGAEVQRPVASLLPKDT